MRSLSAPALQRGGVFAVLTAASMFACAPGIMDQQPRPNPANPLPPGVVRDPATFRRTLGTFQPGRGHRRERDSESCAFFVCRNVDVTIEAVGNTLNVDPKNPPPDGVGFPVAHLFNHDSRRIEKHYGLKPGTQSEYYLWVSRMSATQTQWTLIEVPVTGGQVNAALPTELSLCHLRPPGQPKSSEADFVEDRHDGKCDARVRDSVAVKTSTVSFIQPLLDIATQAVGRLVYAVQGGWIDCSNGCCT